MLPLETRNRASPAVAPAPNTPTALSSPTNVIGTFSELESLNGRSE